MRREAREGIEWLTGRGEWGGNLQRDYQGEPPFCVSFGVLSLPAASSLASLAPDH